MTAIRQINQAGLDLIKEFEGYEHKAYRDAVGVWTIGYGFTRGVHERMLINHELAEAALLGELQRFQRAVEELVAVPLNDNEFAALVSLAYNIGVAGFEGSTARRRLNAGDRQGAADAMEWWNKGTVNGQKVELAGLTRRRAREKALFLKGE